MRLNAILATLVVLAISAGPATAGLDRRELVDAGFHLTAGTQMPLAAMLHGASGDMTLSAALNGKPALLVFTDYRCQSLCGVVLDQLSLALPNVPLDLGRDYNVVSIALDSQQTQDDALAFRNTHTGGSSLHDRGIFFTDDAASLQALRDSVGLVAPFDAEHKQFAHPAGLVLIDAKGRAMRILSPFSLDPFDLKLALTETGAAPGSLVGHVLLLCYGWNPIAGLYTLRILNVLSLAAAATILMIAGTIGFLLIRERRRLARGSLVSTKHIARP